MNRIVTSVLLVASAALIAACGGGHNDAPPAAVDTTVVPDTALASSEAYTSFAGGLAAADTTEPRSVDKVGMPPTSDTAEPVPLN